jgi:hypothetical protein
MTMRASAAAACAFAAVACVPGTADAIVGGEPADQIRDHCGRDPPDGRRKHLRE